MDTLTASSVSSRPGVLQFFRNLFGSSRHVTREGQRPEAKEKDDVGNELLSGPLPESEATLLGKEPGATNGSSGEIREGLADNQSEALSTLKEGRLGDASIRTDEKKLSGLLKSTGLEMGDSDPFADDSMGSDLAQHPCEIVPVTGEEEEEPGDRGTREKVRFSQVLCADDGVSMSTGSMAEIKDSRAEEEREHLLKEDVQVEPPKAELSPWNRLINMYKQRWRLSASKVSHLQDIPVQPVIKEEATLDLMVYGIAAPKAHVTLSNSPEVVCACGLPENMAREVDGDCESAQKDSGTNDDASLEHLKNVY